MKNVIKKILLEEVDKLSDTVEYETYVVEKHPKYYISKPKEYLGNDATIIYGGLLDTPEKLIKDIPTELLNKKIVVLVRFDKPFKSVINELGKNINITSINGFSTGSLSIINFINDYNYVGLIDPLLTKKFLNKLGKSSNPNVESWFSKKFWTNQLGKVTNTINLQKYLKDIMGDKVRELLDYEHEDVKKDFLKNNWMKM